jgi:hypothetical protein
VGTAAAALRRENTETCDTEHCLKAVPDNVAGAAAAVEAAGGAAAGGAGDGRAAAAGTVAAKWANGTAFAALRNKRATFRAAGILLMAIPDPLKTRQRVLGYLRKSQIEEPLTAFAKRRGKPQNSRWPRAVPC